MTNTDSRTGCKAHHSKNSTGGCEALPFCCFYGEGLHRPSHAEEGMKYLSLYWLSFKKTFAFTMQTKQGRPFFDLILIYKQTLHQFQIFNLTFMIYLFQHRQDSGHFHHH